MSIEVGSKWVKDGEVVEVIENCKHVCVMGTMNCTWFIYKNENLHVLTSDDFLEQYKPYEPVYEYQWVILDNKKYILKRIFEKFATDEEIKKLVSIRSDFLDEDKIWHLSQYSDLYIKIKETKRERK